MKNFLFYLLIVFSSVSFAQNVAINATGAAPVASAMLDITSTTSGLLIPRMSSVQRVAIAAPATGLKVYDTTTNTFWWFNGVIWVEQLGTNKHVERIDGLCYKKCPSDYPYHVPGMPYLCYKGGDLSYDRGGGLVPALYRFFGKYTLP
jgi:hypothetical protein